MGPVVLRLLITQDLPLSPLQRQYKDFSIYIYHIFKMNPRVGRNSFATAYRKLTIQSMDNYIDSG